MIKAIIFDFDGLILDTEMPEYQSWLEIYQEFGCDLPISTWAVGIGTSGAFDPYKDLEAQLGQPVDRDSIRTNRRQRNSQLLEDQQVLPGVEDYIEEARRLNLKIGLASSSPRNWVVPHLSRLELLTHFDVIKTHDDVIKAKPDPALYNQALLALGIAPDEAIAIEDSPNGALAAKRAGIFCVVVPNKLTSQLDIDVADLKLASLEEVALKSLIGKVEAYA